MIARSLRLAAASAACLAVVSAGSVAAAAPVRFGDAYTETFEDEFIFDLCGIVTMTTITERWTFQAFPDGREVLHVTRTFVPADIRVPIEKGAGTGTTYPDGTRKVVGSPLRLYDQQGGGISVIAAGLVVFDPFGDPSRTRGHAIDLSDEAMVSYYCP